MVIEALHMPHPPLVYHEMLPAVLHQLLIVLALVFLHKTHCTDWGTTHHTLQRSALIPSSPRLFLHLSWFFTLTSIIARSYSPGALPRDWGKREGGRCYQSLLHKHVASDRPHGAMVMLSNSQPSRRAGVWTTRSCGECGVRHPAR